MLGPFRLQDYNGEGGHGVKGAVQNLYMLAGGQCLTQPHQAVLQQDKGVCQMQCCIYIHIYYMVNIYRIFTIYT